MASRPLPSFYGPARGFAALPPAQAEYEPARAVILPVPYDATTTYRGGTRDGPRAIVDASMQLELYDMELGREIAGAGIHTLPELEPHLGDPAAMVARVAEATALLLADGKLPIMLGGEHTLTVGGVRAARALHPNLALLYLDAHADVRGSYLDAPYNHASALRLSLEGMALPVPSGAPQPAVAVGIRSMAVEEAAYLAETGLPMVTAAQVAATTSAHFSGSRIMATPPPWVTTLYAGHPKLISTPSNPSSSTMRAAAAKSFGSLPKSWQITGCSSGS